MKIFSKDLKIERLKGSGPGGQHRNKRETGIRITHLPTGLVAMATERRSQTQNLELAKKRIFERVSKKLMRKKKRKKTRVPKKAQERRLKDKRMQSERKAGRGSVKEDSP